VVVNVDSEGHGTVSSSFGGPDQFGSAAADPEMIDGMTDASATRRPQRPWTRSSLSTTASEPVPILAVPTA
jgi:hypothetical protein